MLNIKGAAPLSPEQRVSLLVFKMALADHQLKFTKLKADEGRIYRLLMASTGLSKSVLSSNLPPRKQEWMLLDGDLSIENSPHVNKALAELKLAQSQKERADTEAWPDIKIGPTVRAVKDPNESTTFVGVGLSLPFPLFSQNRGNRAFGAQKAIQSEMELHQTKKRIGALRTELVNRYNQTVESLKNSISFSVVNQKHEEIEQQFFKGLISSALVIEAHRQMLEFEVQRNESELEAIESLGQILIIDNKFEQVIL